MGKINPNGPKKNEAAAVKKWGCDASFQVNFSLSEKPSFAIPSPRWNEEEIEWRYKEHGETLQCWIPQIIQILWASLTNL